MSRSVALAAVALITLTGCSPVDTSDPNGSLAAEVGQVAGNLDLSAAAQLAILLTAVSLAPALLVMVTSFTRIVVVLGFLRSALGTPQLPPNQVMVGLALFLTWFVMAPTWNRVNAESLEPLRAGTIGQEEAVNRAQQPLREFMLRQTREKDLALFVELAKEPRPETPADLSLAVIVPAFVISELRTAFQMGFFLFVPFLVIDLVVSTSLMSLGMVMLPPSLISLPFKVLLFVLADGWHLVVRSIVVSFG